jgi:hypothetical protein
MVHNLLAQSNISFYNPMASKKFIVSTGSYCTLSYIGYLNQDHEITGVVREIKDSLVVIDLVPNTGTKTWVLRFSDITGFRLHHKASLFLKPSLQVGFLIASFALGGYLNNLNPAPKPLVSIASAVGFGVASNYLLKCLFRNDVKYKLTDGWQMSLIPI